MAHALETREQELSANPDQTIRAEMQRHETVVAATALNQAAGRIGCRNINKTLPPQPDNVGEIGSLRLLRYAMKCKSFKEYLKVRRQMIG